MVAQGFSQVKDIDCNETYAPITHHGTIRTLLALAPRHQWHIYQMDVKVAFLNSDLSEEIYIKAPSGSDTYDSFVWRLNHIVTNFIRPYLHQFSIDSHGLNGYGKPLKRPFDRYQSRLEAINNGRDIRQINW